MYIALCFLIMAPHCWFTIVLGNESSVALSIDYSYTPEDFVGTRLKSSSSYNILKIADVLEATNNHD